MSIKSIGLFLFAAFGIHLAQASERVVLQLNGEHQFQFAGYYAAQWQGYYKEAGFDVVIRPGVPDLTKGINPIEEVISNRAQYAIGGLDILLAQDQQKHLAILAPVLQNSGIAVFALPKTPLLTVHDLAGLRIAASTHNACAAFISALLLSRGYSKNDIQFVNVPATVDSLLADKADVIVTHEAIAKYQASEKGVELRWLRPGTHGVDFYGDTLYTSADFYRDNSDDVQRFVQASLKGWRYAIKNSDSIVERIAGELPRYVQTVDDLFAYNMQFANHIVGLLDHPDIPLGHFNINKWLAMHERMRALGLVYAAEPSKSLLAPVSEQQQPRAIFTPWSVALSILLCAIVTFAWKRKLTVVTIVSVLVLALLVERKIEGAIVASAQVEAQQELAQRLEATTAKLEGILQNNIAMITGFAAYISAAPDLTEAEFNAYAEEVFRKDPLLINFAAAKDLVVNYVYPLAGNEKVLGLDYRDNPEQREMVEQVVNTGQLMVVGPINLVQGGLAFIGRAPIYTGDSDTRKLWGIISAPIDTAKLYRLAGITTLAKEVDLAIRTYDSLGNRGPVFFGESSVYEQEDKIQKIIRIGGGTWHVAAARKNSNEAVPGRLVVFRIIFVLMLLLGSIFIAYRFKQVREKARLESALREHRNLLETVSDAAKIAGWKMDKNYEFTCWSPQTALMFRRKKAYQASRLSDLENLFNPQDFALFKKCVLNPFTSTRPMDMEFEIHFDRASSRWFRFIVGLDPINSDQLLITMQDVSDKVEAAEVIRHQATYDSLTDLPNRLLYNDRLDKALESARRMETLVGVLFIDLDQFKPVNDNYGHEMGDKLLVEVANRIKRCLRNTDTVARLSGDEFGVILVNVKQYESVVRVAESVNGSLQQPYSIDDRDLHISASIGIALFPQDGDQSDLLVRKADQAMYEVKRTGRNGWQFFTKTMQQRSEARHALLYELIIAISREELVPYFQPICDLQNTKTIKCEALARWIKPDGSFVPPIDFITVAEESGLVNKIDLWMLKRSAEIIKDINFDRSEPIGLSVNVSPRLFHTKDKALEQWLEAVTELAKNLQITVEITERLLTDETDRVFSVLKQLKVHGIKIALDDFGTGYSSLSYLVRFPVDIIKIDRSFVDGIGEKESAESLIETIILMAKKLDLSIIAEGIETPTQLDFLKKHECTLGQGFLLGRPMPEQDFYEYLQGQLEEKKSVDL